MKASGASVPIATGLVIFGLLLAFLLVFHLPPPPGGSSGFAAFIPDFLFRSFHYAAFFAPLYFISCGLLLLMKPFRLELLILLNYLILPFFTLGLALRLFLGYHVDDSPATSFFASSFTPTGGALLASLFVALELVLVPGLFSRLSRYSRRLRDETKDSGTPPEKTRDFLPLFPRDSRLAARPGALSSVARSGAEAPRETPPFPGPPDEDEEDIPVLGDHPRKPSPPKHEPAEDPAASPFGGAGGETTDADGLEPSPEPPPEAGGPEEEEETESLEELFEDADPEEGEPVPEAAGPPPVPAPPAHPAPGGRRSGKYAVPVEGLLSVYADGRYWEIDDETRRAGDVLRSTLEEFKIQAEVVGIRKGPVITMFEILPSPGVKLSKIVNLSDNIALRLAASSVRIVAPIPGKHAVGIEIPNKHRAIVSFAEMIESEKFTTAKMEIPLALGKDIAGEAQIIDLVNTPHLLIAGATGSGKSVCVNSIICSILYRRSPEEVKLLLIDPKIVELKFYNDVPHLLTPVVTEPKRAFQALQYAIYEMERRYSLLDGLGVRDIRSYNRKIRAKAIATTPMPYLVIVVDEFADLMATTGKELETTLARLAAMSRAVGIHLVLATQRPSIDVITGLIKANIPSRIAFMVAGKFDSRIIIDAVGAEKLLGRGDMLFTASWDPFPVRMQGAFLGEEELEKVVAYVKTLGPPEYIDDEIFIDDDEEDGFFEEDEEDPLMDKALEIVTVAGKASASYLQRRLKIGYNRAARLVETMERRGIVGPQDGSKPRRVLSAPE